VDHHPYYSTAALLFVLIFAPAVAKSQDVVAMPPSMRVAAETMLPPEATLDDAQSIPLLSPEQLDQALPRSRFIPIHWSNKS
jgi:hypothetical protein